MNRLLRQYNFDYLIFHQRSKYSNCFLSDAKRCEIFAEYTMTSNCLNLNITILDTTLRDGELTPGVEFTLQEKIQLAELLEAMQVDVIEVGYPGAFHRDFEALMTISKQLQQTTICGLASSKPNEILDVASAIQSALQGRIHIYTPVNGQQTGLVEQETLAQIRESIRLARNYRDDLEWSAFNALNSQPDFLCRAIETAIASGVTTINIPDTLGSASPEIFSDLIHSIVNRVPNIDQATIAVHCHNDQGLAVANSMAALTVGARQIECAINGLGARKGNADLAEVVRAIADHPRYEMRVNEDLLNQASELVTQITGIQPTKLDL